MKNATVKIYSNTEKGMNLLRVLEDMAKTGNDVNFVKSGTVIISDTTERAKGMIGLLGELKPGNSFLVLPKTS